MPSFYYFINCLINVLANSIITNMVVTIKKAIINGQIVYFDAINVLAARSISLMVINPATKLHLNNAEINPKLFNNVFFKKEKSGLYLAGIYNKYAVDNAIVIINEFEKLMLEKIRVSNIKEGK